jgi:hypothetical protein
MTCPICEKRPPKRFCPAKGEKICSVCCGREREVSIDCLPSCPYLVAAYRYEAEHREPISAEEFPYRDLNISTDFVYERWPAVTSVAQTILEFQAQDKDLHDVSVIQAFEALAETYRTLGTGIYYERPPDALTPRALYARLAEFLGELRKHQAGQPNVPSLKESDIFHLLVFLLRVARHETNGRPRSRAFLAFLAERFPLPAGAVQEPSRIIVP